MRYLVIDNHTGEIRGSYSTRQRASRRADKLDLEHGAIRYRVESVEHAILRAEETSRLAAAIYGEMSAEHKDAGTYLTAIYKHA